MNRQVRQVRKVRTRFVALVLVVTFFPFQVLAGENEQFFELGSRFSLPTIDVDADYNIGGIATISIPYEISPSELPDFISQGYAVYGKYGYSGWEITGDFNQALMEQDITIPLDIQSLASVIAGGGSTINLGGISIPVSTFSMFPVLNVIADVDLEIDNRDYTVAWNAASISEGLFLRGGLYQINVNVDADINIPVPSTSLPSLPFLGSVSLPSFVIPLPITFSEQWNVQYAGVEYRHPVSETLELRSILDLSISSNRADKIYLGARWVPADHWNFEAGYQLTRYDMVAKTTLTKLEFDGTQDGIYGSVSYRF